MGPDRTVGPREGTQHLRAAKKTRVLELRRKGRGVNRGRAGCEVQGREWT